MGPIINVETAVESSAEVFDDLSLLLYGGHEGPRRGVELDLVTGVDLGLRGALGRVDLC